MNNGHTEKFNTPTGFVEVWVPDKMIIIRDIEVIRRIDAELNRKGWAWHNGKRIRGRDFALVGSLAREEQFRREVQARPSRPPAKQPTQPTPEPIEPITTERGHGMDKTNILRIRGPYGTPIFTPTQKADRPAQGPAPPEPAPEVIPKKPRTEITIEVAPTREKPERVTTI